MIIPPPSPVRILTDSATDQSVLLYGPYAFKPVIHGMAPFVSAEVARMVIRQADFGSRPLHYMDEAKCMTVLLDTELTVSTALQFWSEIWSMEGKPSDAFMESAQRGELLTYVASVNDLARRRGVAAQEAETWLAAVVTAAPAPERARADFYDRAHLCATQPAQRTWPVTMSTVFGFFRPAKKMAALPTASLSEELRTAAEMLLTTPELNRSEERNCLRLLTEAVNQPLSAEHTALHREAAASVLYAHQFTTDVAGWLQTLPGLSDDTWPLLAACYRLAPEGVRMVNRRSVAQEGVMEAAEAAVVRSMTPVRALAHSEQVIRYGG